MTNFEEAVKKAVEVANEYSENIRLADSRRRDEVVDKIKEV